MAPVTQYVFAEMLGISEHFTAGSHEWLPYRVIPGFPKHLGKHQLIALPGQSMSFLAGAMYCFYYTVCIRIRKEKKPGNAPIRLIRPSGSGKFYPVLNSTAGRIPFSAPATGKSAQIVPNCRCSLAKLLPEEYNRRSQTEAEGR